MTTLSLEPPFRWARAHDAAVLAELVNAAGQGLPHYLWSGLAQAPDAPSDDPWAIGRARQAAKTETDEIVVVDFGEGAVAGLTGYPVGAEPEPLDDLPALFRPLQELENLALRSWYVNVLAALPGHRGQGLGTRLLGVAERLAIHHGTEGLSVIVADDNLSAQALYARLGYVETARRPVVKEGWATDQSEWILMLRR